MSCDAPMIGWIGETADTRQVYALPGMRAEEVAADLLGCDTADLVHVASEEEAVVGGDSLCVVRAAWWDHRASEWRVVRDCPPIWYEAWGEIRLAGWGGQ